MRTPLLTAASIAVAIVCTDPDASAQRAFVIETEAVDNYPQTPPGDWGSIQCTPEAAGFYNSLVAAPGTIWQGGNQWVDDDVWDTDYTDPDRGYLGNPYDDDTTWFDHAGQAMSYVCVHGDCDDFVQGVGNTQFYNSSADCTNGPPWMGPGACIGGGPPSNQGICAYRYRRQLVFNGHTNNHYGGFLDYSDAEVGFGEDAWSGSWGQAGTNGGIT